MDLREYERKWESLDADEELTVGEESIYKKYVPPEVTKSAMVAKIAAECEAFEGLGGVLRKLRWLVKSGNTRPDFLEGFECGEAEFEGDLSRWAAYFGCYSMLNSELWGFRAPVPDGAERDGEDLDLEARVLTELLSTPLSALVGFQRAYGADALARRARRTRVPLEVHVVACGGHGGGGEGRVEAAGEERWIVLQQLLGGASAPEVRVRRFGAEAPDFDERPPLGDEGRDADYGGRARLSSTRGPYHVFAGRYEAADLVVVEDLSLEHVDAVAAAIAACAKNSVPVVLSARASGDLAVLLGALDKPVEAMPNPFASLFLGDRGCGDVEARNASIAVLGHGAAARQFSVVEATKEAAPPAPSTPVRTPWPLREARQAIRDNAPGCAEYSCGQPGGTKACGRCRLRMGGYPGQIAGASFEFSRTPGNRSES